jgi:hypothetical protein
MPVHPANASRRLAVDDPIQPRLGLNAAQWGVSTKLYFHEKTPARGGQIAQDRDADEELGQAAMNLMDSVLVFGCESATNDRFKELLVSERVDLRHDLRDQAQFEADHDLRDQAQFEADPREAT